MKEKRLILLVLVLILIIASPTVKGESDNDKFGEWNILNRHNFSSQIRLHPHILLFVCVPWSGECRSLMRQVSHFLFSMEEEFRSLKLMYMYHNGEKILADAIGATEDIAVFYYHQSESYKYRGRLRASNILFSIQPYFSVSPEQIPLTILNTQEELKTFLESTDKAFLLLEFCGWTRKFVNGEKNGTENASDLQGDFSTMGSQGESDSLALTREKEDQKETKNGKLTCPVEDRFGGIPLLNKFTSLNNSARHDKNFEDVELEKSGVEDACNFEVYRQFRSSFSRFMTLAKEFFLPIERHRFALVSDKTWLSSLGVGYSGSWSVMLYFRGCPSCSMIVNEGEDLKRILQMDNPIVNELEDSGHDLGPAIPASGPSLILFVDRWSHSLQTQKNAKEALDSFRELALRYHKSDHIGERNSDHAENFGQASQEYKTLNPQLSLSSSVKQIKLNDKMSIMIMNEGKPALLEDIASHLQGSSLHEMLTLLLQRKETKISTVAKQAGFQLLSADFDVKLAETLTSEAAVIDAEAEPVTATEAPVSTNTDLDETSASSPVKMSQPGDISSLLDNSPRMTSSNEIGLLSVEPDHLLPPHIVNTVYLGVEINSSSVNDNSEEVQQFKHFNGSFFFCDGNYRFLRALTGEDKIPSMVIIDPIGHQHYVMSAQEITYSSMENFLHKFHNGSLAPYQRSEAETKNRREETHPPFVNHDFHEADAIPRMTARTFFENVLGLNKSSSNEYTKAWDEDVVVLFSNSWCGFCQRMELIVREVFRAMKGYVDLVKGGFKNGEKVFNDDSLKDATLKFPKIFLMDCSVTDCSIVLKSLGQREVYPTLLLFPADKENVLHYEGDMAVSDVIKFVAEHGTNTQHLISETGILWMVEGEGENENPFQNMASMAMNADSLGVKEKSEEILLKNPIPKTVAEYSQLKPRSSKGTQEQVLRVAVGSNLVATEKIIMQPFHKSTIIIMKADQNSGFQGLICNKPIGWNSLNDLQQGLELLKEAPLYFGGPLVIQGMPLTALTRREVQGQYTEFAPGIHFVDQAATISEIEEIKSGRQSLSDYWFFLGFSSWGWDQLFNEIAEGAWILKENMGHLDWPES